MAVRPRGTSWQADVARQGKRYRATFDNKEEAEAWELEASDALRRGKTIPQPTSALPKYATIESLLQTVVTNEWSRQKGSSASIIHATKFVEHVGPAMSVREAITQSNIDEFITDLLEERQISGSTVNRYLSAISKLMKKAVASGDIPRKLELPWQREGEARLRWFDEAEEALILQTLRLWGREDFADFFMCLVDTGARTWVELGALKWGDISATKLPGGKVLRTISFWDTKNGDSRAIPLTHRAWEAIQRQPKADPGPFTRLKKDEGRRVYERLRGHLPQLRDTVWYTARHTFASRLVQRGVDLYRVQKLMGHRSITMTMRYAKLAPTHLIEAISVLEPVTKQREPEDA